MDSYKKPALSIIVMLLLSVVGVYALGALMGSDDAKQPTQTIPEKQEYSSEANASTQIGAVMSQLYYEDHRQDVTARLGSSGLENPNRVVNSVTLVSHSTKQSFAGTHVESQDGEGRVQYRYVDADVGAVAEASVAQNFEQPPTEGWETTDARYSQSLPVPVMSPDADWEVKAENESTVVLEVRGGNQYINAKDSSVFDSLASDTYVEVYIDVETGRVTKIIDHQVGVMEQENGDVRGPFVFHRVVTFEYGAVDLERPDALDD